MIKLFVCGVLVLGLVPLSGADPASPAVRVEIDALLGKLQSSACEFNRNGAWHNASTAKTHLLQKLKYLEDRNAIQSTEQFIELGASRSSVSGKSYLVRCANAAAVESKSWLAIELKAIRSSTVKPISPNK